MMYIYIDDMTRTQRVRSSRTQCVTINRLHRTVHHVSLLDQSLFTLTRLCLEGFLLLWSKEAYM